MDLYVLNWPIAIIDNFKLYGLFLSLKSCFTLWITLNCLTIIYWSHTLQLQLLNLLHYLQQRLPADQHLHDQQNVPIWKYFGPVSYEHIRCFIKDNIPSFYTIFMNSNKYLININNSSYNHYRTCDNIFFNYYKTSNGGGCSESLYLANIGPSVQRYREHFAFV